MDKFSFSSVPKAPPKIVSSTFNGRSFYNLYKKADFLSNNENLEQILFNSYPLKRKLDEKNPGETVEVVGFMLAKKTPLILKKPGKNVKIEDFEFTYYRLCGLVAAYVFENRKRLPMIKSSEAKVLGLTWDNQHENMCRLYLSAVAGSQDFYDQFNFLPLLCVLRKYQLKKTTPEAVEIIANMKTVKGETMAQVFMRNYPETVKRLWMKFPGAKPTDLQAMLATAPANIKSIFKKEPKGYRHTIFL